MDDAERILQTLREGDIKVKGEFLWGSNYTFLVDVTSTNSSIQAVYKPTRGERPLWDFPASSLGRREVAAYIVSEALGWDLVPPTIYRRKGPIGSGSLQLFIEHNPEYHYFTFTPEDLQRLRPVVLFDTIINNADRKGSHLLKDPNNHLWLIDHGVSFHVEDKLRTVIWDFAGEAIPAELCNDINIFIKNIDPLKGDREESERLLDYLNHSEVKAIIQRGESLLKSGCFPSPDSQRRSFPWPQL